jgi:hypothetical protein
MELFDNKFMDLNSISPTNVVYNKQICGVHNKCDENIYVIDNFLKVVKL